MSESEEPTIYDVRELVFEQQKRISELESTVESQGNVIENLREQIGGEQSDAGRGGDDEIDEGRVDPSDPDDYDSPADGWSFGDWRDADVLETLGLGDCIPVQAIESLYEKRAGMVDEESIEYRAERLVQSELFEMNDDGTYTFVSEDYW